MDKAKRASYFTEHRRWLNNGGYKVIAKYLESRVVKRNIYEAAPVTEEKSRAMTVATDPVTLIISDMLENNPAAVLFTVDVFYQLFIKHVAIGLQKYLLNNASLELLTKRTKIKSSSKQDQKIRNCCVGIRLKRRPCLLIQINETLDLHYNNCLRKIYYERS